MKAKCCAGFSCSGVFRSIYNLCFWAEAPPCINTRTRHERALNAIAKRVSRGSKTLRGCRAAPCWGQGAKPLGFPQSTRGQSMKERSTQSRERVKGGTHLWGQGAKPLGFPPINTRAKHERALNSIARKGQGRNSLVGLRGKAPCGVQRQSLWRLPLTPTPACSWRR